MAPHARRRAVAAALLLRHAATFTYTRPMRVTMQLRDTYLIDNEDVGGPLEPLSDYLLVKVDETAEKTSGGIMISDKAKEPPPTGVVQTVGPGALHPESGTVLPIDCKEGDNVMWGRYAGLRTRVARPSSTSRHRADAVTRTTSRRWRAARREVLISAQARTSSTSARATRF
jgi:chaperonin GroES